MKYAVLIDGGFLRRKLGSRTTRTTLAKVSTFLCQLRSHPALANEHLHRIYWYDAPPLESTAQRPLRGGHVNFGASPLALASRELLHGLERLPYVSMRRGELIFRGWRVSQRKLRDDAATVTLTTQDIEPNIQQKGVDMRIGLDMASLTLKGHAQLIVLVTGDSDFVPAMKFARREGAQLLLVTLGHAVRPEMLEHADAVLDISATSDGRRPKCNTGAT
jgi:uncharacterized LabA/DUF88 family protein